MKYKAFSRILNQTIFEDSKIKLIKNILRYPQRYIGLFRPTKAEAKIVQNLLQSQEIRMGDAMEKIMDGYLEENGFNLLHKGIMIDGESKALDLYFKRGDMVYFAEMKIRDDHDSNKKKGQANDFKDKINHLSDKHGKLNLHALLFFVDPAIKKNRNFYEKRLKEIENSGVKVSLVYGEEFFKCLELDAKIWIEIESHLRKWKKEIPEFPEVNFDKNANASAEELKSLSPRAFQKVLSDETFPKEIREILFPNGKTLRILKKHFSASGSR